MTTLGSWLNDQGFHVEDDDVPYGRESEWHGVDWILVHHTVSDDDGAESSIASYVRNGGSGTYPPLAQIMLGQSGTVWMCSKERSGQSDPGRASHAGSGSGYGVPVDAMNAYSLGIECQCDGSHKLAEHPTLYATLIELCAALCRRYGLPADHVIGHKEWSTTGKVDPRDDMDAIRADVAAALGQGGPYVTEDVYRSKCGYGEPSNGDAWSATVKELQHLLNRAGLAGGQVLDVTGVYDDATDQQVRLWQEQVAHDPPDPAGRSFLGPLQFELMFPGSVYTLHDDGDPAIAHAPEPPTEPEEPEPPSSGGDGYAWDSYSGKPSGTLTVTADAGYVRLDADSGDPPGDGLEIHMAYINCDLSWSGSKDGTIRVKYVRDDGDDTGYQDYCVSNGKADFLITAMHWEAGEKGKGGRWYINVGGGITKAVISTRYQKAGGVTYDVDGAATAARVTRATVGLSPRGVRAVAVAALAVLAGLVVVVGRGQLA